MLENIVIATEEFWRRELDGQGKPGWTMHGGTWGGPVTDLILNLFERAEIPQQGWPGRSTIRDAMKRLKLVK